MTKGKTRSNANPELSEFREEFGRGRELEKIEFGTLPLQYLECL